MWAVLKAGGESSGCLPASFLFCPAAMETKRDVLHSSRIFLVLFSSLPEYSYVPFSGRHINSRLYPVHA